MARDFHADDIPRLIERLAAPAVEPLDDEPRPWLQLSSMHTAAAFFLVWNPAGSMRQFGARRKIATVLGIGQAEAQKILDEIGAALIKTRE